MLGDESVELSQGDRLLRDAESSLKAILSGVFETDDVNRLVRVCHSLAVPHVRKRLTRDGLLSQTLRLNFNDFAYDCIAELFAFGKAGEFPHFHAYFAAYPVETLSQEDILSHLRRLVFSHTNQGIFRLYNEADPILGKIIRNIKLAVQQFQPLKLIERFGEPSLVPVEGDCFVHLPALTKDELECGLRQYLNGNENIPFMLGKLALFIQEQTEVSRTLPLSMVATVFRAIYLRSSEEEQVDNSVEGELTSTDLKQAINTAITKVKAKMIAQYARKKNVDPTLVEKYFLVIERKLNLTFSGDGKEKGLNDLLKEHIGNLNDEEYKTVHKNRLEYLWRLTGDQVASILKARRMRFQH